MSQHDCICPVCGTQIKALPVTILPERGMVISDGKFAVIPTSEMLLLQRLAEVFPRVLSKESAMSWLYAIKPDSEPQIKIVDVFICKLRKKVEPLGLRIDTIWGKGYVLGVTQRPRIVAEDLAA